MCEKNNQPNNLPNMPLMKASLARERVEHWIILLQNSEKNNFATDLSLLLHSLPFYLPCLGR